MYNNITLNSLTGVVALLQPLPFLASFEDHKFANFSPLTTLDSSKCAQALPLELFMDQFLTKLVALMSWVEGPLQVLTFCSFFASVYRKLASKKLCFVSVILFHSKLMTLAAAGAIRRRHLPDDAIQLLLLKPWMWFIGWCTPYHTATSAWPPKLPAAGYIFLAPPPLLFAKS